MAIVTEMIYFPRIASLFKQVPLEMSQRIPRKTGSSEHLFGAQMKDRTVADIYYFPFTVVTYKLLLSPFFRIQHYQRSLVAASEKLIGANFFSI